MTDLNINLDKQIECLVGLLNTPSPTGYYVEAAAYVQQDFNTIDVPLTQNAKGALIGMVKGANSDAPRGITAHLDTLGTMVKEIKSKCLLKMG